ncbi:MAG: hypothetical protein H7834_11865 [Magnetococcus sp. YQC-9]
MRPADPGREPGEMVRARRWWHALLLLMLLLSGCSEGVNDPLLATLTAKDTMFETLERLIRPERYWSRKVSELEAQVEVLRNDFQTRNEAYHEGLLKRRHSVREAVREARERQEETQEARIEAIQQHRTELARARDEAKETGRTLRIRMSLLRKAREQLDLAR